MKNPFKVTPTSSRSPRQGLSPIFHCVTTWSRPESVEGVSTGKTPSKGRAASEAKFVVAEGYDFGWTTNLPLADLDDADVLVADRHDGEPIDADHGGPLRLIVPKLYARKPPWLKAIELTADNEPGFWEKGGYHDHEIRGSSVRSTLTASDSDGNSATARLRRHRSAGLAGDVPFSIYVVRQAADVDQAEFSWPSPGLTASMQTNLPSRLRRGCVSTRHSPV